MMRLKDDEGSLISRAFRYFQVIGWQLAWARRFRKIAVITCVGLGGLNMVLLGAVIGVLFLTLNSINEGITIPWVGYTLHLEQFSDAVLFAGTLLGLLAIGGITGMFYNRIINRLSVEHEEYVVDEVVAKYHADLAVQKNPERLGRIMQMAAGGARLSGRSLRVILSNLLDMVRFLVFLGVCTYLEWRVTLTIILVLAPFYFLHGLLNLRIHRNEAELEQSQSIARDRLREVIGSQDMEQKFSIKTEPTIRHALMRYKERINAAVNAQVLSDLGFAWALALGLLWFLYAFSTGSVEIGVIVAYLFSLRFLLQSIRALSVGVAVFTRHYGRVRRVRDFLIKDD